MRFIRTNSISRRLTMLVALTSATALLLACTVFVYNSIVALRESKIRQMSTLADVTGSNCSAALAFGEQDVAQELLQAFKARPTIDYACILDESGDLFAEYVRNPETHPQPPTYREAGHRQDEDGGLEVLRRVIDDEDVLGSIYLHASMEDVHQQVYQTALIAGLVVAASLLVAILLGHRLQNIISKPILHLATTAQTISAQGDYSIRVEPRSADEIGDLYTQFNEMLDRIEGGENALVAARDELEDRVQQRTDQLGRTNDELHQQMLAQENSARMIAFLQGMAEAANQAIDSGSAIQSTLRLVCEHTGYPVGHAYLLDEISGDQFKSSGRWYLDLDEDITSFREASENIRFRYGEEALGGVWESCQPVWITELDNDATFRRQTEARKIGLQSAFAFPILVDSKVVAVFEFFSTTPAARDNELLGVMNNAGRQLGRVFERQIAARNLSSAQAQVVQSARRAGMAEVATGVLHNIGNVLNSVNISASVAAEVLHDSKVTDLARAMEILEPHADDMASFVTTHPQGIHFAGFLLELNKRLSAERTQLTDEIQSLTKNVEHMKQIVSMQQTYSKDASGISETVNLPELLEDALSLHIASLGSNDIAVVRDFEEIPLVNLDKHKVLQILVNLVTNAEWSLQASDTPYKQLTLRIQRCDEDRVRIEVVDNGLGIDEEHQRRVFTHGFTTKQDGHGFGLHSGVCAAREMGGDLVMESAGLGHGAKFTLEIPATEAYRT